MRSRPAPRAPRSGARAPGPGGRPARAAPTHPAAAARRSGRPRRHRPVQVVEDQDNGLIIGQPAQSVETARWAR
jgi:hypothetical protein